MATSQIDYLSSGSFFYGQNGFIVPHKHKYYQIFYIMSGSCRFHVGEDDIASREGTVIFIKSGIKHSMDRLKNSTVRLIDIKFQVANADLRALCERLPSHFHNIPGDLRRVFNLIFTEGKEKRVFFEYIISSYTCELLYKLTRMNISSLHGQSVPAAEHSLLPHQYDALSECAKQTICLLEEHIMFHRNLSITDMADILGYSKEYIEKCFSRDVGCSIKTYFKQLRMDKAKELLATTSLDISDISKIVGYDSISYFSRVFKNTTGYTANEFRRLANNSTAYRPLNYGFHLEER